METKTEWCGCGNEISWGECPNCGHVGTPAPSPVGPKGKCPQSGCTAVTADVRATEWQKTVAIFSFAWHRSPVDAAVIMVVGALVVALIGAVVMAVCQ
jgi:hypothetical protein